MCKSSTNVHTSYLSRDASILHSDMCRTSYLFITIKTNYIIARNAGKSLMYIRYSSLEKLIKKRERDHHIVWMINFVCLTWKLQLKVAIIMTRKLIKRSEVCHTNINSYISRHCNLCERRLIIFNSWKYLIKIFNQGHTKNKANL